MICAMFLWIKLF